MSEQKYCAFISYRHQSPDQEIAKRLHTLIENYRIPSGLRKGKEGIRPGKVFRDQEELPLSPDLGKDIRDALDRSDWLICICSPRYLQSRWCMRELEYFLETHSRSRVLTVLAEGEPEESFSETLLYEQNAAGERVPVEPLAADVRGGTVHESLKKLKKEKLRILAPMLGTGFDSLYQRQHRRQTARILTAAAAAVLILGAFLAYALVQNGRLDAQRRTASRNECDLLIEKAAYIASQNRMTEALDLAMQARAVSETVDGYHEEEILEALERSCYQGDLFYESRLDLGENVLPLTTEVFSPDGKRVAAAASAWDLACCERRSGQRLWTWHSEDQLSSVRWKQDGTQLAVTFRDAGILRLFDAATGEELRHLDLKKATDACFAGETVCVLFGDGIVLWDPEQDPEGQDMGFVGVEGISELNDVRAVPREDGGYWLIAKNNGSFPYRFVILDPDTRRYSTFESPYQPSVDAYAVSPDGRQLFIRQFKTIYVFDLPSDQIVWEYTAGYRYIISDLYRIQPPVWQGDLILDNVCTQQWGLDELDEYRVEAYRAQTGEHLYTLENERCLGLTPEGNYLLCANGIYRAEDGALMWHFKFTLRAIDPSGTHYLIRDSGSYQAVSLGGGTQTHLDEYRGTLYKDSNETHLLFSPDERYYIRLDPLGIIDTAAEETEQMPIRDFLMGLSPERTKVAFSADSRLLALGGDTGSVSVYDLATGTTLYAQANSILGSAVSALTFSSDGEFVMAADYGQDTFSVGSVKTGRMLYLMHALKPVADWGFETGTGDAVIVYEDGSAVRADLYTTPEELYAMAESLYHHRDNE